MNLKSSDSEELVGHKSPVSSDIVTATDQAVGSQELLNINSKNSGSISVTNNDNSDGDKIEREDGNGDKDEKNKTNVTEFDGDRINISKWLEKARIRESEKAQKIDHEDEMEITFPMKLMEILSEDEHKSIISWLDHGKGFMIVKKRLFVEQVMPKYLNQTKFPSFTRKLSRWGFVRVPSGPEVGVYHHEMFLRDNPLLCLKIRCIPARGVEAQTPSQYLVDQFTADRRSLRRFEPYSHQMRNLGNPDRSFVEMKNEIELNKRRAAMYTSIADWVDISSQRRRHEDALFLAQNVPPLPRPLSRSTALENRSPVPSSHSAPFHNIGVLNPAARAGNMSRSVIEEIELSKILKRSQREQSLLASQNRMDHLSSIPTRNPSNPLLDPFSAASAVENRMDHLSSIPSRNPSDPLLDPITAASAARAIRPSIDPGLQLDYNELLRSRHLDLPLSSREAIVEHERALSRDSSIFAGRQLQNEIPLSALELQRRREELILATDRRRMDNQSDTQSPYHPQNRFRGSMRL